MTQSLLATPKPGVFFTTSDTPPTPFNSMIGGPGVGAPNETVRDASGKPLTFLAQFSLYDLQSSPLSTSLDKGLLQFFIDPGPMLGCAFPSQHNHGFLVRYLPSHTRLSWLHASAKPLSLFQWDQAHVHPKKLTGTPGTNFPCLEDVAIQHPIRQATKALQGQGVAQPWTHPDMAWVRAMEDAHNPTDSRPTRIQFGGWPTFVQQDPRANNPHLFDHTLPLLALGSSEHIRVQDDGELVFLINPDDWAQGNLRDILYTWDAY